MSDLEKWWNAPQEGKALTEADLRQALEACHDARWKPDTHYVWTEEGKWAIVTLPDPPPKQRQRERSRDGGTGLPGESVGGE